jgi:hypothetical protein
MNTKEDLVLDVARRVHRALLARGRAVPFGDATYRQAVAVAIADALPAPPPPVEISPDAHPKLALHAVEEQFDVWHEVPLVQQLTGMSCWAAAAAMLVGWRDCVDVDPEQVAKAAGRWESYRDGLVPEDVLALAETWGLFIEPPRHYTVGALRCLLEDHGPLWVGEASPGLHVVVITGMSGDGSPAGTRVRVADPWPVGRGDRYSITFAEWSGRLKAASGLSGVQAQVLHTGGRGGSRRVVRSREELQFSMGSGAQRARYGTPAGLFARLPITDALPVPDEFAAPASPPRDPYAQLDVDGGGGMPAWAR